MAEYFLPTASNMNPQKKDAIKAPMLVRLPSNEICIVDIGADSTVSLDTKFAIVYDGHAYIKPVRDVNNATVDKNRIITYYFNT
jgi:5-keto 4-deoxyuronate isomerase